MTLIVVLFTIVFLLAGYYLMNKIDRFIENKVMNSNDYFSDAYKNNTKTKEKSILIYGNNALTRLVQIYCDEQKYIHETIRDASDISNEHKYICLLALSYNDAENLTISSIGLKIYSISNIVVLCNDQKNFKLYKDFNFKNVVLSDEKDKLFNHIKELVENAVESKDAI